MLHLIESKDLKAGNKIRMLRSTMPAEIVKDVHPHPKRPEVICVVVETGTHHCSPGYTWELIGEEMKS